MIEFTDLPPFRRELLLILANRANHPNDYGRMFAAPNSFFHVVMGNREPTDRDFIEMSAYLEVSEDYLRSVFNGDISSNDFIPAPIGGG